MKNFIHIFNLEIHLLKDISPGYSLEGLRLKLKLQYFGHLMRKADSFEKTLMVGGQEEKGTTEDEMAGWHHQHNGHGFGWTLGVGDGQEGLACYGSWGRKESDMTEQLNWTELKFIFIFLPRLVFIGMLVFIHRVLGWIYQEFTQWCQIIRWRNGSFDLERQ